MSEFEYAVDGHIAVMRLNRPEKLNAITYEMLSEIDDALAKAASDNNVRAVVLTGTGRAFSAGTDLQQLSNRLPGQAARRGPSFVEQRAGDRPAPWTFSALQKPTVAAVNGVAVGLGAELTLHCDLRIAAESARFGWVFVHRGLVADTGAGTWLLSRIVGLQNAAYLLYSGEIIDAARAKAIGYVLDVVPDAELMDRAMAVASAVAKGSPLATGETKRLLYQGLVREPDDHNRDSSATLNRMFASEDFKEGVRAFLERRDPQWTGR